MSTKELLKQFMADNSISQSAIARGIGRSTSAVSQFLKGGYAGDVEGIERDISAFIALQEEKKRENRDELPFIETRTSKRVLEFLRMAHVDGEMQVLHGAAGLGKSRTIKEYVARNSGVILIDVDPTFTARDVLEELCRQLGIPKKGNMKNLMDDCIRRLKHSQRLVIVDEAELLPHRALEILRRLHDRTGIGMVLAGMDRLLINLTGRNGEYAQLYSRIAFAFNIGSALPQEDIDTIALAAQEGLSRMKDVIYEASQGNARRLSKILRRIQRMCSMHRVAPDKEMIDTVVGMLIH